MAAPSLRGERLVEITTVPPTYDETIAAEIECRAPSYPRVEATQAPLASRPPTTSSLAVAVDATRRSKLDAANVVVFVKMTMHNGLLTPGLLQKYHSGAYLELVKEANEWAANRDSVARGTVLHNVSVCDTIEGLSLKYGTNPAAIRNLNRLGINGSIFGRQSILIPVGPDAICNEGTAEGVSAQIPNPTHEEFRYLIQHAIISSFQFRMGCTEEEARITCDLHDFDLDKAMQAHKSDQAWLQSDGKQTPAKTFHEFLSQIQAN